MDVALRLRLEDFFIDYAHAVDDGHVAKWPSFFTREGRYQITSRENHQAGWPIGIMLCEGRAMMEDRMLALATANIFEPHTYCHQLSRARYWRRGDGMIEARSNFSVIRTMQDGRMEVFAAGKYLDEIVVDEGGGANDGPKFLSRTVVLDSKRVDILLVYPL